MPQQEVLGPELHTIGNAAAIGGYEADAATGWQSYVTQHAIIFSTDLYSPTDGNYQIFSSTFGINDFNYFDFLSNCGLEEGKTYQIEFDTWSKGSFGSSSGTIGFGNAPNNIVSVITSDLDHDAPEHFDIEIVYNSNYRYLILTGAYDYTSILIDALSVKEIICPSSSSVSSSSSQSITKTSSSSSSSSESVTKTSSSSSSSESVTKTSSSSSSSSESVTKISSSSSSESVTKSSSSESVTKTSSSISISSSSISSLSSSSSYSWASALRQFDFADKTYRFDFADKTYRFDFADKTYRFDFKGRNFYFTFKGKKYYLTFSGN